MFAESVEFNEVKHTRARFYSSILCSIGLAIFVHLVGPNYKSDDLIRTILAWSFFGCLASVAWSFQEPYRDYLASYYRWKFVDTGQAIQHSVELYITRQSRFFNGLGWVGIAASTIMGMYVFSHQPLGDLLSAYQSVLKLMSAASFIAILAYVIIWSKEWFESMALRRSVFEQVAQQRITLRTEKSEIQQRSKSLKPGLEITGPMAFRVAEYDWDWSDFYSNVAIFGQTGSGKTLCVLNPLLEGLIGSSQSAGSDASGLILDPKGDYLEKIRILCARYGREKDLLLVDPNNIEQSIHWNPLDSQDDSLELASRFAAVMETLNPSSDKDTYWINQSKDLIQNLISLMRCARPSTPPSLVEIYDLVMNDQELENLELQIETNSKEAQRACHFLQNVWMNMAGNTRGTIRSFISNMLGPFLLEPYDELFSGSSTLKVGEIIDQGKILYVHMPLADKMVMAKVVSTFIKLEFYRQIRLRRDKPRPSFFLCDEFQSFFTVGNGQGDADAFEITRQSRHANIIAFQNINALLKQTNNKQAVENLLGNCATEIFLRNSDYETNEKASKTMGEHIISLQSSNIGSKGILGRGNQGSAISSSAQFRRRVPPEDFSRLKVPSVENGVSFAEAWCKLGARANFQFKKMNWKVHEIN